MYCNNMMIYFLAFITLWPTPGYTTPPSFSEEEIKELNDHARFIISEICSLHLNNKFSDVILVVNEERIPAHRYILALSSKYFSKLFYGSDDDDKKTYKSDVKIPEVPVKLFKIFLEYTYTANIQSSVLTNTENSEFLKILDVFDVTNLKACSESFKSHHNRSINHIDFLIRDISKLHLTNNFSDVVLVVNNEPIHAHRFLLASQSEYFSKLFYEGDEGDEDKTYKLDVQINETRVTSFKKLMKFMYTGEIQSSVPKDKDMFELLKVADYYGVPNLKSKLHKYMQKRINYKNVFTFFTLARFYQYQELEDRSLNYIENHVFDVMHNGGFLTLTAEHLQEILNRDTFYAEERYIFNWVCQWINANKNQLDSVTKLEVLSVVRYPLMSDKELREARKAHPVLEAIQFRNSLSPEKHQFRAQLKPDMKLHFKGFPIDNNGKVKDMIKLEKPSTINYIDISLWCDIGCMTDAFKTYSYYIEVSMNGQVWKRVIDHSNYNCRSRQKLWIHPQKVWYVKIVGTNDKDATFSIWDIKYKTVDLHNIEINNGFVVPKDSYNVASNAIVIRGENSVIDKSLLNNLGVYSNEIKYDVYTYHLLGSDPIVVHLAQPYILSSMSLLLWGGADQTYSYFIEASVDNTHWETIADKSNKLTQSWQDLQFESRLILYIRITGVSNSVGDDFRCVYLEAPSQVTSHSNYVYVGKDKTDIMMT